MSLVRQKSVREDIHLTEYQVASRFRGWMQLLERQLDDMSEPVAGMMRMSADDDDQADQQHELVDLGMAETDHYSVLETP